MPDASNGRIVTVTATIMDGIVVRWFGSVEAAENPAICGVISASRNGVVGGGDYITPDDWKAAWSAHERLKRDPNASLRDLATHRAAGLMGPLEPVSA